MGRALVFAVMLAACGGADDTPGGGGNTCSTWRINNADDATALQGTAHAGSTVDVNGGVVTASFDGTLPNVHAINGWDDGALYSKRILAGDFDAQVHLDATQSSTDALRAFFAVQSGLHGGRVAVARANGGSASHTFAMGGGTIQSGGGGAGADLSVLRIVRTAGMIYAGFGTGSDFSTFEMAPADDVPLLVAVGIAAENYPDGAVTGTATATFSGLVITTADGSDCFASGLE